MVNEQLATDKLFPLIRVWAKDRGLYHLGDLKTQFVKLSEEQGELAQGIIKGNRDEVVDAIGDMVVVLTNIAEIANLTFPTRMSDMPEHICHDCGGEGSYYEDVVGDGGSKMLMACDSCEPITLEYCLNQAWNEIKDRTGGMKNGSFVKDK